MQAINIVSAKDIAYNMTYIMAILVVGGIEDILSVILEDEVATPLGDMLGREGIGGFSLCTIGIYPCMEFHTTLMTLLHHPLQWIPIRRGSLALLTGEETAPRFDTALIECVALGAHLEDDGVGTVLLQFVQLIGKSFLHFGGGHTHKLSVDALYPSSTELAYCLCRHVQRHI